MSNAATETNRANTNRFVDSLRGDHRAFMSRIVRLARQAGDLEVSEDRVEIAAIALDITAPEACELISLALDARVLRATMTQGDRGPEAFLTLAKLAA